MKNIFIPLLLLQATISFTQVPEQPNIIMVILDDMNDWVEGLNGHPQTITPNITELATQGTLFTKAYNTTPQCGPSRISMLTGKHSMYTKIYRNTDQICGNFRANFTAAKGNAEIFTLPEYLKDSVGYFTYGINKVFHCHENGPDYDVLTADPCEKNLSWNKHFYFDNAEVPPANTAGIMIKDGLPGFAFAAIPDSLETTMLDYRCIDSAITFIDQYVATGGDNTCNKPLFLAVGLRRPHTPEFVPEHYFLEHYMYDFHEEPYDIPYNVPANAYPANGVIMPPQPEIMWGDFYNLPEGGVARDLALESGMHEEFLGYPEDRIDPFPEIDPALTDEERLYILQESERANAVMAYLAAIRFSDAQIGRLYDALQSHPEMLNNTILIVVSDNGYSMGEKMHWRKTALWETDNRVPLLIADFRNPVAQVCNKTVSLLDIFPTIIDLIDAPAPEFSDGSDYLDGKSMAPLLTNAQTVWERPSLATVRNSPFFDGSCFPQYSIRNDRFHYIEYTTNGLPGGLDCDSALSEKQAELYDIGVNFETDPNEWNNLIDSAEYQPVVDYMQQWLPGGPMYLQKGYASEIQLKSVLPCLLDNDDMVKFKARVFYPEGGVVSGAALSSLQLQWTNSITGETKFGANYTFKMTTVPPAVYAANDHVLIYLKITEIATGKQVGFNTYTLYFNTTSAPAVSYNALVSGTEVDIIDYSISGTYTNTYWKYTDGFFTEDFLPATYTFATTGNYKLRNYVQYGNGCTSVFPKNIVLSGPPLREGNLSFKLYPNPTQNTVYLTWADNLNTVNVEIYSLAGQLLLQKNVEENFTEIDMQDYANGTYLVRIISDNFSSVKVFEVAR